MFETCVSVSKEPRGKSGLSLPMIYIDILKVTAVAPFAVDSNFLFCVASFYFNFLRILHIKVKLVLIERINTALQDFIVYLNNHKLRTELSHTPNQLWMTGLPQNIKHETGQQIINQHVTIWC